ncbi:MAG: gliding motility lipoprotein GldD [Cytophagales bacterium]|nr:gliding motility lipoprotein GldD [Cytophagales bacterium]
MNTKISWLYTKLFLGIFCFLSCGGETHTPRPQGYSRLNLPEAMYQPLPDSFPYFFEYSKHATLENDSSWIAEPYWIKLFYPDFQAAVQITYKPISNPKLLEEYIFDSYKLTAKHQIKASHMEERILSWPKSGIKASWIQLKGEVPSPFQFHVSDSSKHFLRAAVYLQTATKNDSLAPLIDYLKEDMLHLLSTLRWK